MDELPLASLFKNTGKNALKTTGFHLLLTNGGSGERVHKAILHGTMPQLKLSHHERTA